MQLLIKNKDTFIKNFLTPISNVTESALLSIEPNKISCISNLADKSFFLKADYKLEELSESTINIAISDVKKFIKFLNCLDESSLSLKIENNYISSNNSSGNIKFYLYDEIIINRCKLNFDNVLAFNYQVQFEVPKVKIQDIIKAIGINDTANKLYLSGSNGKIEWELTDKSKASVNSIGKVLHNNWEGCSFESLIIDTNNLKLVPTVGIDTYNFNINIEKKILLINIIEETVQKYYLISSLEK